MHLLTLQEAASEMHPEWKAHPHKNHKMITWTGGQKFPGNFLKIRF